MFDISMPVSEGGTCDVCGFSEWVDGEAHVCMRLEKRVSSTDSCPSWRPLYFASADGPRSLIFGEDDAEIV